MLRNNQSQNDNENIYIHGTNSTTLMLLPYTNFELMGPVAAFFKYRKAPLCGELGEGLYGVEQKSKMAFGFARATGADIYSAGYGLGTVIDYYAKSSRKPKCNEEKLLDNINAHLSAGVSGIEGINRLVIQLLRANELGLKIDVTPEQLNGFIDTCHLAIQLYYLALLLGRDIYPDVTKLLPSDLCTPDEPLKNILSLQNLANLIKNNEDIDIKNVYENPTEKNIQKTIKLLNSLYPDHELFTTKKCKYRLDKCRYVLLGEDVIAPNIASLMRDHIHYAYISYHGGVFYKLNLYFNEIKYRFLNIFKPLPAENMSDDKSQEDIFRKSILKGTVYIQKKLDVVKDIVNNQQKPILDLSNRDLYDKQFPLVLVYKDDNQNLIRVGRERRSRNNLTLGVDIVTVATDSEDSKARLNEYLKQHDLDKNVKAVLFEDLKKCKDSNVWPDSFFAKKGEVKYQGIHNQKIDTAKLFAISQIDAFSLLLMDEYRKIKSTFMFLSPNTKYYKSKRLKKLVKKLQESTDQDWVAIVRKAREEEQSHPYQSLLTHRTLNLLDNIIDGHPERYISKPVMVEKNKFI